MTKRTLSEIAATATKAARGAGCPWGMAEEAGMSVRSLEAHGLAGVAALAKLLETPRDCTCSSGGEAACSLKMAARIADEGDRLESVSLNKITAPLIIFGTLLQMAKTQDACFALETEGMRMVAMPEGANIGAAETALTKVNPCEPCLPVTLPDWKSRDVDPKGWAILEAFAARTLVPETDASRASGAGPTGNDND